MISRRGLIGATLAAAAVPHVARAQSGVPQGAWRPNTSNVNWAHPLGRNLQFSFLSNGATSAHDYVRRMRGTISGTPVGADNPWLGDCVNFTGTQHFTWADRPPVVESSATIWALVELTSLAAAIDIFTSSSASSGWGREFATNGALVLRAISVNAVDSTFTCVINVPYLLIVSNVWAGATNMIAKRLDTGAIQTFTSATTQTPNAANGTYVLGADAFSQNACTANIAGVAYALTGMSLSQMVEAAQDPWGPWRTQPLPVEQMVASAGASVRHRPRAMVIP